MLSLIALAATAILSFTGYSQETVTTFNDSFILDLHGQYFKSGHLRSSNGVFIYAKDYLIDRNIYKGEYFILACSG